MYVCSCLKVVIIDKFNSASVTHRIQSDRFPFLLQIPKTKKGIRKRNKVRKHKEKIKKEKSISDFD